jgi:hypothetical protein
VAFPAKLEKNKIQIESDEEVRKIWKEREREREREREGEDERLKA